VAAECGWFETAHARHALKGVYVDLGLAATAPLRHYVALRGEVALGMASAFFTGDVVLLAAVAVRPSARREGIGRALALVRLREARERHCSLAVLAPSPHGAEMYEAMAFESHLSPPDRWFYAPLHRPGGNAIQGPSQ
jgi:predicted N-acetyltransferase YhbS